MTSMFGKKERLYADARASTAPQQEPPRAPERPTPEPAKAPESEAVAAPRGRAANLASSALELAGVAAVSTGGFLVAPWVGCMILGVLLIMLGVAIGFGA